MARFCGVDPSLIDEVLEAAKERQKKESFQKESDEKSVPAEERNGTEEMIKEGKADAVGDKR